MNLAHTEVYHKLHKSVSVPCLNNVGNAVRMSTSGIFMKTVSRQVGNSGEITLIT